LAKGGILRNEANSIEREGEEKAIFTKRKLHASARHPLWMKGGRHGLVRLSSIPPPEIRELRSLTGQCKEAGARERNLVQRSREEANTKRDKVLSAVFGVPGQRMLDALLYGKATPAENGHRLTETLRFMIAESIRHMEFLEKEIAALDEQIAEKPKPFAQAHPSGPLAQPLQGPDERSERRGVAPFAAPLCIQPRRCELPNHRERDRKALRESPRRADGVPRNSDRCWYQNKP